MRFGEVWPHNGCGAIISSLKELSQVWFKTLIVILYVYLKYLNFFLILSDLFNSHRRELFF